jgi:hypothetical protein
MLSPYRVLDLTDEGALICGGSSRSRADVILVEPPGGVRASSGLAGDAPDGRKSSTGRSTATSVVSRSRVRGRKRLSYGDADILLAFGSGAVERLGLGAAPWRRSIRGGDGRHHAVLQTARRRTGRQPT